MGKFIYLTGTDGVGKSTHCEMIPGKHVWMRMPFLFSYPVLVYCRLRGLSSGKQWYFYKSLFISWLFPRVLLFDTLVMSIIKIYIPMALGKTVICDRYVYDILVDLEIATSNGQLHKWAIGGMYKGLIPTGSSIVLLTSSKPRRENYMALLAKQYLYRDFGLTEICTDGGIDEVHKEIIHALGLSGNLIHGSNGEIL